MNQIYLLQNQHKLFLSKQSEWVDGRELGSLFKTRHKDEALNYLFEVNAKDYSQRIHLLACDIKANGFPLIKPEDMPPPLEKPAAEMHEQPDSDSGQGADPGPGDQERAKQEQNVQEAPGWAINS